MADPTLFVGLDVHKRTIAVAVAPDTPGSSCTYYGTIANTPDALRRLTKEPAGEGAEPHLCYEAGPCGYAVQRRLSRLGHRCGGVAPTPIPRQAGDRVKDDRRDAPTLAQNRRAGHPVEVWVFRTKPMTRYAIGCGCGPSPDATGAAPGSSCRAACGVMG